MEKFFLLFLVLLCDKFFLIVMSAHLEIHTNKTNLREEKKVFHLQKEILEKWCTHLEVRESFKDLKQFSFHDLIYRFVTSLKFHTPSSN